MTKDRVTVAIHRKLHHRLKLCALNERKTVENFLNECLENALVEHECIQEFQKGLEKFTREKKNANR